MMKTQISRLSPHQNAKVVAILMAISSLIFLIPMVIGFSFISPGIDSHGNQIKPPSTTMFLFFPIAYLVIGYITTAIACMFYNFMFKYIGRMEYESHELEERDIHTRQQTQPTPLHAAAYQGNKDIAELLIVKDADVITKTKADATPLHAAAYQGNKDIAELLIAKGADVNAKTNADVTPLHGAALKGHKDIAELLIAKGADVSAKDRDGFTPLHNAVLEGNQDIAELLIAKGADVNVKDKDGHTPLNDAIRKGHDDVAEVLRQRVGK
jgi:hypothetical protein